MMTNLITLPAPPSSGSTVEALRAALRVQISALQANKRAIDRQIARLAFDESETYYDCEVQS
jgi:hypothetical protein